MPAHLRPLSTRRCQATGCPSEATNEVRDGMNGLIGVFCLTHSERRLATLQASERVVSRG